MLKHVKITQFCSYHYDWGSGACSQVYLVFEMRKLEEV